MRTLSHAEARKIYDRIGAMQDTQAFYEDRATSELVRLAEIEKATRVFEFGCGTGRFAARLLSRHLPPSATYKGVDLSPTMINLASKKLASFAPRGEVVLSEGDLPAGEPAGSYDRFLSNFVFDLLSEGEIRRVIDEAHRMLRPGGLLCLSSLSTGATPFSRAVARLWTRVHGWRPALLGGCRPIALAGFLQEDRWRLRERVQLAPFGLPSEVIIGERC
ncbi:MAG: class I SAM-dependent methyltransferase [Deltaproteobacteria bacterium]|nr:class I SAM-dependent methyltransferase [Deltaproteobacteria bacterium]